MKKPKLIIRLNDFQGRKHTYKREKAAAQDIEHKPYIRRKRVVNLPDSWDTKWIKVRAFRGWKTRVKKRHPWVKHAETQEEKKMVTGRYNEKYIMYLYGKPHFVEIDWSHMDDVEILIKEGKLEGGYEEYLYHDGTKKRKILRWAKKK